MMMVGKCNSAVLYFDLGPRSPFMMPGGTVSQLEHRLEEMLFSRNHEWKLVLESPMDTVSKSGVYLSCWGVPPFLSKPPSALAWLRRLPSMAEDQIQ